MKSKYLFLSCLLSLSFLACTDHHSQSPSADSSMQRFQTTTQSDGSTYINTSSYEYQIVENGCDTGDQKFSSIADLCSGLQNETLNKGCALELRKKSFAENCTGQFQSLSQDTQDTSDHNYGLFTAMPRNNSDGTTSYAYPRVLRDGNLYTVIASDDNGKALCQSIGKSFTFYGNLGYPYMRETLRANIINGEILLDESSNMLSTLHCR